MATRPARGLKVGEILDKTIGVVSLAGVPALIFIAVIGGLSAGIDIYGQQAQTPGVVPSMALIGRILALAVLVIVVAFIGSYLLLETMLKRAGLVTYTGDKRILAYVGLALLSGLGTGLGFLLLIIPGLVFMARWSIAGPLLIGKGEGVMASLGKSWEATKGSEFPIILCYILVLVFTLASYLPILITGQSTPVIAVISRLISTAGNVFSAGISVAVYGILRSRDVSGTFS